MKFHELMQQIANPWLWTTLGLFSFGKSKGKTKQEQTTDQTVNRDRETAVESTKSTTQAGSEVGRETTRLLSEDVQGVAEELIAVLGQGALAGGQSEQAGQLASALGERAQTADADIGANFAAILDESRRSGERDLQRLVTDLSQQAGSSQNTFVAAAAAEGRAALESQLASLRAQLNLTGRQQATQELQSALTAIAGEDNRNVQNLTNLINSVRGAEATATSTKSNEQTVIEELESLETLSELVNALTIAKTEGKSKSSGFSIGF